MLKVRCPVVVEGRYDKIRLSSVIDGVIIETGGYRVFKDAQLLSSLRTLAKITGLIILTDSDAAGFRIRNYLKGALGEDAKLTHIYVPSIKGKERRKSAPSEEGLIGVEGMTQQVLLEAFSRAGIGCETVERSSPITKADLYDTRLTGFPESAARRQDLLSRLNLPMRLSISAMLPLLNTLLTREEFFDMLLNQKK